MYRIHNYSKKKAKALGVTITASKVKGKKLDVFKNRKKVASVGAIGYLDYPTYKSKYGTKVAEERRRAYKQRHSKDRSKVGTPGYYADKLLW